MSMAVAKDTIDIRAVQPGDLNFIFATWLQGLRYGNDLFKLIHKDAYFGKYHKIIEAIIAQPGVGIAVACLRDAPEVIIGYSVIQDGSVVHWIFVKPVWRNFGIGKSLMPKSVSKVTHITKVGERILAKKFPDAIFDPFI